MAGSILDYAFAPAEMARRDAYAREQDMERKYGNAVSAAYNSAASMHPGEEGTPLSSQILQNRNMAFISNMMNTGNAQAQKEAAERYWGTANRRNTFQDIERGERLAELGVDPTYGTDYNEWV